MQKPELMQRTAVRFAVPEDQDAIRRFNERLRLGGRTEAMPSAEEFLRPAPNDVSTAPAYKRLMVATDGDEVRSGILLHHHVMCVRGAREQFCWCIMPVSEGLVNKNYSMSILRLMKSTQAYEPFLLSLGVGSTKETWAQLLISLGWRTESVPFFFLPLHSTKMLDLPLLQKRRSLKWVLSAVAYSGAGALARKLLSVRRRVQLRTAGAKTEIVSNFGKWADEVFEKSAPAYPVTALRDATCLNSIYPKSDPRFVRLRVRSRRAEDDLGWIVVSAAQMHKNVHFGNLKIGILVDGFGEPSRVPLLISAGTEYLSKQGVDLIVANWSHLAWRAASRSSGFLQGPSSYFLFWPKSKSEVLASEGLGAMHFTRGDSDGMVNLRGNWRADASTTQCNPQI
jgi:hypothetical protein